MTFLALGSRIRRRKSEGEDVGVVLEGVRGGVWHRYDLNALYTCIKLPKGKQILNKTEMTTRSQCLSPDLLTWELPFERHCLLLK